MRILKWLLHCFKEIYNVFLTDFSFQFLLALVSFSVTLFLQFQFLLALSRTTVINNNIDNRVPGPLNLIFANQFKCITRVKLRVFVLKVAISRPHLTF